MTEEDGTHLTYALCLIVYLPPSVVLWLGDLNYRLSDLEVDYVKDLIIKKDFETLHNYDQVISEGSSCHNF